MKIYDEINNNVFDAVDSVVKIGIAVIEGTKTQAVRFSEKIIEHLEPYDGIDPGIGYLNVPNRGYLYFVYDRNKFPSDHEELYAKVREIDAEIPI